MTLNRLSLVNENPNMNTPSDQNYYLTENNDKYTVNMFLDIINKRLKVIDFEVKDYRSFTEYLEFIAQKSKLSKIILDAPENHWQPLFACGFLLEAIHPTLFKGKSGFHLSKFLSQERITSSSWEKEEIILKKIQQISITTKSLPNKYIIRTGTKEDISLLVPLFAQIFETYPTPITDTEYLSKIMNQGALFKVISYQNKIISAASIYIDPKTLSAELTDCATLPEYQGQGLMSCLVSELEKEAKNLKLITLYTYAEQYQWELTPFSSGLILNITVDLLITAVFAGISKI
jgi:putative beta-lysine N-acetyltransferase